MLLGFNFDPISFSVHLGTFSISVNYRCLFTRLRLLYLLADLPLSILRLRFLTLQLLPTRFDLNHRRHDHWQTRVIKE